MGRPKAAQEGRNGGEEAKRRPGGRSKTARIEGGEGLLPWSWPASARPQVLLARPARRAGLGSSARAPGGCPQAPISYQKTTRPLKRVRPPAPPFPRLWLFAIDSAFWRWFLGPRAFWRSRVLTPALGSLDLDRTGSEIGPCSGGPLFVLVVLLSWSLVRWKSGCVADTPRTSPLLRTRDRIP